jgi:serine protease AprX
MHRNSLTLSSGIEWDAPARRQVRNLLSALVAALVLVAGLPSARPVTSGPAVAVIVRAAVGTGTQEAADAVHRVGGDVVRRFEALGGLAAEVPASAVARLARIVGPDRVTPNGRLELLSSTYEPGTDLGSLHNTVRMVGGDNGAAAGLTGKGVDIALIDSGVAPVEGLTSAGKVVNGPDLSFDSGNAELRHLDTFGHGTHMAGIIAGKDSNVSSAADYDDASKFTGVAPDARIVSVKVAASDGSTDVSQVLAGIDWVVQHRKSNGLNIRVLNLSFGTNSTQSYVLDPLAYAAEVAWRKGIVVVASAGNGGIGAKVTDPAMDPYVIAVGASDHVDTRDPRDDVVASFSTRGDQTRRPDVLAPGRSVVSLRDPGSFVDTLNPNGQVGERFFRGTGTSQAAAVTTGAVALLLQRRPSLSPDGVKRLLMANSTKIDDETAGGRGIVRIDRAVADTTTTLPAQQWPKANGTGSLEAARGGVHVVMDGVELAGEKDIFGVAWDGTSWSGTSWSGTSWSGGNWNGTSWSGDGWLGTSWSGTSWSGTSWSGTSWSGTSWSGTSWSSGHWTGTSWSGTSWSGTSWSGTSWSGTSWSGTSWSGTSWSGTSWSGTSWSSAWGV